MMHVETIDEYFARGGTITVCPTSGRSDRELGAILTVKKGEAGWYARISYRGGRIIYAYQTDNPAMARPKAGMRVSFAIRNHEMQLRAFELGTRRLCPVASVAAPSAAHRLVLAQLVEPRRVARHQPAGYEGHGAGGSADIDGDGIVENAARPGRCDGPTVDSAVLVKPVRGSV